MKNLKLNEQTNRSGHPQSLDDLEVLAGGIESLGQLIADLYGDYSDGLILAGGQQTVTGSGAARTISIEKGWYYYNGLVWRIPEVLNLAYPTGTHPCLELRESAIKPISTYQSGSQHQVHIERIADLVVNTLSTTSPTLRPLPTSKNLKQEIDGLLSFKQGLESPWNTEDAAALTNISITSGVYRWKQQAKVVFMELRIEVSSAAPAFFTIDHPATISMQQDAGQIAAVEQRGGNRIVCFVSKNVSNTIEVRRPSAGATGIIFISFCAEIQ